MSASGSPIVAISQSSTATSSRGRLGREHRVAQAIVAVHDRGRAATRAGARPSQLRDALHRGELARLVVLPQPAETPHLALQVAGRLAEALEAGGAPVDRVDLDERVDQLLADPPALLGRVQGGGVCHTITSPWTRSIT